MKFSFKLKSGVTIRRYSDCYIVCYKGKILFSQKFLENNNMYTYYYVIHLLVKMGLARI
jgi:hypothetical protein